MYITLATTERMASQLSGQRDNSLREAGKNPKFRNPLREDFMMLSLGRNCQSVCRSMLARELFTPLLGPRPPTRNNSRNRIIN